MYVSSPRVLATQAPANLSQSEFSPREPGACLRSGKSNERHAEGARPPRRRKYISVFFGLLSHRAGLNVFPYEIIEK